MATIQDAESDWDNARKEHQKLAAEITELQALTDQLRPVPKAEPVGPQNLAEMASAMRTRLQAIDNHPLLDAELLRPLSLVPCAFQHVANERLWECDGEGVREDFAALVARLGENASKLEALERSGADLHRTGNRFRNASRRLAELKYGERIAPWYSSQLSDDVAAWLRADVFPDDAALHAAYCGG